MKKGMMIILFTMTFYGIVNAQLTKGTVGIGGSFGIDYSSSEGSKDYSYSFLPSVDYFIQNNTCLGIDLGIAGAHTYNGNKTFLFIIDPYVKQYWSMGEHLAFFCKSDISVGFGKLTYSSSSASVLQLGVGVAPGVALILSKKAVIEGSIGLIGFTSQTIEKTTTNRIAVLFNPSTISLGVKFMIN